MERCGRGTLYSMLNAPLPLAQHLRNQFSLDAARGLLHLHESGLLHREIKSANVLITDDYHAKLGSFGFAKAKTESRMASKSVSSFAVRWMAPEMFNVMSKFTEACDVFSFGVLLNEIFTGEVRCS